MNVPTAPYRPVAPPAFAAEQYLPWLINQAVRVGRDNGYGHLVDDALALILAPLGVRTPRGGFVDSDGRNAQGTRNGGFDVNGRDAEGYDRAGFDADGFNRQGLNRNGQDRDTVVEALVDGWDGETAAAYARALANRVA